ncbi:hypothetical protein [Paenibacillus anseongense]|uniref:hypothetical protein n=1 Tax=Paenibacillus anseongense TaxID=2682845 RepID=UPI002DB8606C|nr:hypothetical protein [Paenibacillus anseongense]MEC0265124.1 hypothetical protein [Paenibacillus anseongense]
MGIKLIIEKVVYERDTETLGITSDVEEAIKICKSIDGDYNVSVWKNGIFSNLYMDIGEDEIRELFNET